MTPTVEKVLAQAESNGSSKALAEYFSERLAEVGFDSSVSPDAFSGYEVELDGVSIHVLDNDFVFVAGPSGDARLPVSPFKREDTQAVLRDVARRIMGASELARELSAWKHWVLRFKKAVEGLSAEPYPNTADVEQIARMSLYGTLLERGRISAGMNKESFAAIAGLSLEEYTMVEYGGCPPLSEEKTRLLCKAMKCDPEPLIKAARDSIAFLNE